MSQNQHCEPTPPVAHLGSGESSVAAQVAVRPMTVGNHEEIFFHPDLLRSLRIHRRLVMMILGTGIAFALAYGLKTWPVYVAESLVYIQPAPPRLMGNGTVQSWPFDESTYESYMQQQVNNVTRSDVLRTALHRLPAGSWQRRDEAEQAAMELLARALTVGRIGTTYQIGIAARSSRAAAAAQISNAVAGSFIEIAKSDLRAGDPQRIKLLSEERDRIEKALDGDRSEQGELNKAMGVAAVGAQAADPYDAQISELRVELAKARAAHDEAGARLTAVAATTSSAALDAEADEIVASDAGLVSMKASLNQRRALLISQMANLTPNHPQSKQDADELAQINVSLENMMKDLRAKAAAHIQQRLRNDLERTSAMESRLNAQVAQLSSLAGSATPRMQRSNDLATDIQRLQNRFTAVDEQYRNLTLENNAPGAAYISAAAVPPLHASVSRMMRNVMIILVGALMFAVVAAVAAHNLDPRIYIATDVERVLGFSPMAQLPDFHQVSGEVGEEYMLRLAAAIEHAYQQGGFKSCIFTGVGSGAGVTTVAARVRNMLEGMGRSTVLVDASGALPAPSDAANQESNTGLVPAVQESRPSALLQQMAEEMDSETIVLTDTAPLLSSGETEYLARFVDSAIVVIQSGLTTRAQLREVAQTLQRLEVAAVGFVLNRVSIEKANPSFRQSVRAVEQRLAMQSRLHARHAPRTRPSAHHDQDTAQESFVVTKPEPVKPPVPMPPPDASRQPSPTERPIADSSFPTATTRTPVSEVESSSSARVARGRGEPHRSGAVKSPPFVPEPGRVAAAPVPPLEEQIVLPTPTASAPPPPPEPRRAPIPPARPAAVPPVSRGEERWAPPPPPAALSPVREETAPDDLAIERDDPGYAAASRLGGLRNLLVSLGRRSLTTDRDSATESNSDLEPRFERATMRPAYAEPSLTDREAPDSGISVRLTAQPEFLPPKPTVEVEKEKETVRPTPPRRDNPDGDEIQTLPSWRGQYRKKRYPPI